MSKNVNNDVSMNPPIEDHSSPMIGYFKNKWWNRKLTLKCKLIEMLIEPMGIREPHEVNKKSLDLGGNRTHDLGIRSTVTLPTELRGPTEKVGDDFRW